MKSPKSGPLASRFFNTLGPGFDVFLVADGSEAAEAKGREAIVWEGRRAPLAH